MTCFLVRDLLPLYLEDDCKSETEHVIEEHLKTCSSCREMYDMMSEPFYWKVDRPLRRLFCRKKKCGLNRGTTVC